MSDPVDNRFVLINTTDGGANWKLMDTAKMPPTKDGEAAFAASGTCLITQGKNNAFLVSGGTDARVFRSTDRGLTWTVADTPIVHGTPGSGIFSIAMFDDKNGVIVGGNYEKPDEAKNNLAFTKDGGKTWRLALGLSGYRSGVVFTTKDTLSAVGSSGSDYGTKRGRSWKKDSDENLNSVQALISGSAIFLWAVGPNGNVALSQMVIVPKGDPFNPM